MAEGKISDVEPPCRVKRRHRTIGWLFLSLAQFALRLRRGQAKIPLASKYVLGDQVYKNKHQPPGLTIILLSRPAEVSMGCVSEETLDCLAEAFRYRQQQKRSFRGWNKIVRLSKQSKAEEKCNLLRAEAEEAKNQSQALKQEVDGLHLELQQLRAQHADALLAAEKAHSIDVSKIVADSADLRNKMRQQVDMSETCSCPLAIHVSNCRPP